MVENAAPRSRDAEHLFSQREGFRDGAVRAEEEGAAGGQRDDLARIERAERPDRRVGRKKLVDVDTGRKIEADHLVRGLLLREGARANDAEGPTAPRDRKLVMRALVVRDRRPPALATMKKA